LSVLRKGQHRLLIAHTTNILRRWSSEFWRCVVLRMSSNFSEKHAATIFRAKTKKTAIWTFTALKVLKTLDWCMPLIPAGT